MIGQSTVTLVETISNAEDGLEALIFTLSGGRHPFRAVLRDTDADETVCSIDCLTLEIARRKGNEFVTGEVQPA